MLRPDHRTQWKSSTEAVPNVHCSNGSASANGDSESLISADPTWAMLGFDSYRKLPRNWICSEFDNSFGIYGALIDVEHLTRRIAK